MRVWRTTLCVHMFKEIRSTRWNELVRGRVIWRTTALCIVLSSFVFSVPLWSFPLCISSWLWLLLFSSMVESRRWSWSELARVFLEAYACPALAPAYAEMYLGLWTRRWATGIKTHTTASCDGCAWRQRREEEGERRGGSGFSRAIQAFRLSLLAFLPFIETNGWSAYTQRGCCVWRRARQRKRTLPRQ